MANCLIVGEIHLCWWNYSCWYKEIKFGSGYLCQQYRSILVDIWEDQIALVKPGNVYRLTKLQVRMWAGKTKLTSTTESLFTLIADTDLYNVCVLQDDAQSDVIKAVTVLCIDFVKRVESSTHCLSCSPKLLQTTASKTAHCDRCGKQDETRWLWKTNVCRRCCSIWK